MTKEIIDDSSSEKKLDTNSSNPVLESQQNTTFSNVTNIIDYNPEEIARIDELMKYVTAIDDLIKSGKKFANSFEYNSFYIGYERLNDREKAHFKDIFRDLRIKYLEAKIEAIENGPNPESELSKATIQDYSFDLLELLDFGKNRG